MRGEECCFSALSTPGRSRLDGIGLLHVVILSGTVGCIFAILDVVKALYSIVSHPHVYISCIYIYANIDAALSSYNFFFTITGAWQEMIVPTIVISNGCRCRLLDQHAQQKKMEKLREQYSTGVTWRVRVSGDHFTPVGWVI